jgi:hypothetical protein
MVVGKGISGKSMEWVMLNDSFRDIMITIAFASLIVAVLSFKQK